MQLPLSFLGGTIIAASIVSANWPPTLGPFMDACYGKSQATCKADCKWSVDRFPWCFNAEFLAMTPSPIIDVTDNIGLALKFFSFTYGVHLSEGTMKQDYYNVLVDDCAKLCLESAAMPGNRRCLSFDFYPFETPLYSEPWLESAQAGICSLNTETSSTARLRNEDQGYTDAELFYQSHFSHRPVSDSSGFYEARDSRGDSIGNFLDYNSGDAVSLSTVNLWGKSRWGLFHLDFPNISQSEDVDNTDIDNSDPYISHPASGARFLQAKDADPIPATGDGGTTPTFVFLNGSRFTGGFTPVDDSQRCPGMLTKDQTSDLCKSAGGRLCTLAEVNGLKGRKLGCSLDSYPVWALEDRNTGTKFARCCADYEMSIDCASYLSPSRLSFCGSQKILSDCTSKASGTTQQIANGFGHLLDSFRDRCAQKEFGSSCQGALMRPWYFREKCLWCPLGGISENAGSCRVGGDFGICPNAPSEMRTLFGFNLWHVCGKTVSCTLKKLYPDLILPSTC